MRADRLLKLAEFVETIPRKNFNIEIYGCETVGCALGHAAAARIFKDLRSANKNDWWPCFKIDGKIIGGLQGAMRFFEIDFYEADNLFYPYDHNRTPKRCAKIIREFVKSKEQANERT